MKKVSLLLLSLLMTFGAFSQSYRDWSRWSVTIEGGLNIFDGDIKQDYGKTVIPTSIRNFTPGVSLEYTITPIWSVGADYYYLPLSADTRKPGVNGYSFDTKMNNVSIFTSLNAIKWFFPNTNSKWGLWGGFGFGYSLHKVKYDTDTPVGGIIHTRWGDFPDSDYENDKGRSQFVPIHALVEYNVSKAIAVGAKAQYRAYFVDDIDGRFRPNANDGLELGTLLLRWKFIGNDKKHTRNSGFAQYSGEISKNDLDKMQNQINGIVIPIDNTDKLNDLEGRVKKLEDYLDIDGPDDDNDGVANSRDQEPNTPAGNQVDFWGRTIPKYTQQKAGSVIDESALIYFDFDKTNLDTEAYKAIELAASKLKADPSLVVEVRGFTDNMGTNEYNAKLSQRRADVVKNELVSKYGIDANRIIANGKGKYNANDESIPYRLYRTTVFFYNK